MKCLYIAHRVPYPPNKGEKLRSYHQIRNLTENGVNVTVYCPIESDDEANLAEELQRSLKNCSVKYFKLGSKLPRYGVAFMCRKSFSEAHFYHSEMYRSARQQLVSGKFDSVVCTASSMAPIIVPVVPQLKGKVKIVMDFMDLDSNKWEQYANQAGFIKKWIYQREQKCVAKLENDVGTYFDAACFVAEPEAKLFSQAHGQTKCEVINFGNGIDPSEFSPPPQIPSIEPPHFLFAGVMDYEPNVDAVRWFFKEVWPTIVTQWPEAKFTIAGMNPTKEILDYGKQSGVEVTGFVDDILPYFHQANLFVAPFRIARGIQNKILQAMACGLPVVATSMGAEGIRYIQNENILIADSPEQFIESISQLLLNKDKFAALRANGLATIERHYSWSGQLEPLRNLLGIQSVQKAQ